MSAVSRYGAAVGCLAVGYACLAFQLAGRGIYRPATFVDWALWVGAIGGALAAVACACIDAYRDSQDRQRLSTRRRAVECARAVAGMIRPDRPVLVEHVSGPKHAAPSLVGEDVLYSHRERCGVDQSQRLAWLAEQRVRRQVESQRSPREIVRITPS